MNDPARPTGGGRWFAKLDSGIVDSTLWMQPDDVLRVWVAMMAKANASGYVRASVPSMAHLCRMPIQRLEEILDVLLSPDPYSRTPTDEGRRIRVVDGGWQLINYLSYRNARDSDATRERKRAWDRENRPSGHARAKKSAQSEKSDTSPTPVRHDAEEVRPEPTGPTKVEVEVEVEAESSPPDRSTTDLARADAREAVGVPAVAGLPPVVGYFEGRDDQMPCAPNPAAPLAIALNRAGFSCTSMTPKLAEAAAEGVTVAHLMEIAAWPEVAGKPATYVIAIARRERAERAAASTPGTEIQHATHRKGSAATPAEEVLQRIQGRGGEWGVENVVDGTAVRIE